MKGLSSLSALLQKSWYWFCRKTFVTGIPVSRSTYKRDIAQKTLTIRIKNDGIDVQIKIHILLFPASLI